MVGGNSINSKVFSSNDARRFSSVGVRYHDVEPSDTMASICSRYGVSAPELRRANLGLNGSNVQGGPRRLIVPAGNAVDRPPFGLHDSVVAPKSGKDREGGPDDEKDDSIEATAAVGDKLGRVSITEKVCDNSNRTGGGRRFSELGVRYHDVAPSDTMSSICSRYGIAASALRKANFGLNGSNVQGGPRRLIIPTATDRGNGHKEHDQRQEEAKQFDPEKQAETKTEGDIVANDDNYSPESADVIQYHYVQPTDTLQYICLKYKVTAVELRKLNNFRGNNLKHAPEMLAIPWVGKDGPRGFKKDVAEGLVRSFLSRCPTDRRTGKPVLSRETAVGYLECNGWDAHQAVRNLKLDLEDGEFKPREQTRTSIRRRSLLRVRGKTLEFD